MRRGEQKNEKRPANQNLKNSAKRQKPDDPPTVTPNQKRPTNQKPADPRRQSGADQSSNQVMYKYQIFHSGQSPHIK